MRIHVAFGAELKGVLTYVAGSGSSRALSPFSSSIVASRIIALLYVPLLIVYRIRFDSAGEGSSVQTPRRNRRPSVPTRLKPATEPRIAQTVLTRGACRMIGCSPFQTYGCFATLNRHKKFLSAKKTDFCFHGCICCASSAIKALLSGEHHFFCGEFARRSNGGLCGDLAAPGAGQFTRMRGQAYAHGRTAGRGRTTAAYTSHAVFSSRRTLA